MVGKLIERIDRDKDGHQTGEWTTYDAGGKVVKVTTMKPPR
jgi:antitoxin component YwqK of YwqJK toxin-antitoxin module